MSTITAESMFHLSSAQPPCWVRREAIPAHRVAEVNNRDEGRVEDNRAETALVEGIRRGEEAAFMELVERFHLPLLRVALTFVHSKAVAEEVVQDTWMAVVGGISRFEGRSSLKTWIFRILINRAKTQGVRESRYVEFPGKSSSKGEGEMNSLEDPAGTLGGEGRPGTFVGMVSSQREVSPERQVLNKELGKRIDDAIHTLPVKQRQVILLRDVEGVESGEVCRMLGLSDTNQRVLLHRARTKVREALESYMKQPDLHDPWPLMKSA